MTKINPNPIINYYLQFGDVDIDKFIKKHKYDVQIQSIAMRFAAKNGIESLVDALLPGCAGSPDRNMALVWAVNNKHFNIVEKLIPYAIKSNENIYTAALKNENIDILNLLLKKYPLSDYSRVLAMAVSNNDMFDLLLDKNIRSPEYAFFELAKIGNFENFKKMQEKFVVLNNSENQGLSLVFASLRNNKKIVDYILDNKDILEDKHLNDAINFAFKYDNEDMLDLIIKKGKIKSIDNDILTRCCVEDKEQLSDKMIRKIIKLSSLKHKDYNCFKLAIINKNKRLTYLLYPLIDINKIQSFSHILNDDNRDFFLEIKADIDKRQLQRQIPNKKTSSNLKKI